MRNSTTYECIVIEAFTEGTHDGERTEAIWNAVHRAQIARDKGWDALIEFNDTGDVYTVSEAREYATERQLAMDI